MPFRVCTGTALNEKAVRLATLEGMRAEALKAKSPKKKGGAA